MIGPVRFCDDIKGYSIRHELLDYILARRRTIGTCIVSHKSLSSFRLPAPRSSVDSSSSSKGES